MSFHHTASPYCQSSRTVAAEFANQAYLAAVNNVKDLVILIPASPWVLSSADCADSDPASVFKDELQSQYQQVDPSLSLSYARTTDEICHNGSFVCDNHVNNQAIITGANWRVTDKTAIPYPKSVTNGHNIEGMYFADFELTRSQTAQPFKFHILAVQTDVNQSEQSATRGISVLQAQVEYVMNWADEHQGQGTEPYFVIGDFNGAHPDKSPFGVEIQQRMTSYAMRPELPPNVPLNYPSARDGLCDKPPPQTLDTWNEYPSREKGNLMLIFQMRGPSSFTPIQFPLWGAPGLNKLSNRFDPLEILHNIVGVYFHLKLL